MYSLHMPDILVFMAGGARYGVAVDAVQEVVRAVSISPIPGVPAIVEGAFSLRGVIVPLLDLRSRFGHSRKAVELSDRFIVVRAGRRTVALHADATEGMASVAAGAIADVQHVMPRSKWITGTAALPDGLVLIHDVETFLTAAEADALAGAVEPANTTT